MTHRSAQTNVPILPVLRDRWSPYVYEARSVEDAKLVTLFEAARWAASSYNEQPWRFIVAKREDEAEFSKALECLMEANQAWAKQAGVLGLTVVAKSFARNGNPNRVAEHDLGLAMGNLCAQATELGLHVHQMGGVNLSKIKLAYQIPEGFEPVTGFAIGYLGDAAQAAQELAQRDEGPRSRRPLPQSVFAGAWEQPASWL